MRNDEARHHPLTRRRLLTLGSAATLATCLPRTAYAVPRPAVKSLAFHNLHTGERVEAAYWRAGSYVVEARAEIDTVLRDFRTGDIAPIDPRLLDLLHALRQRLDTDAPFHVISGYRSPATNAALAAKSGGVAKKSLHMQGMAIDIRLPGRDLKAVWREARGMRRGGVGLYAKSDFVHLDVGRVRYW